MSVHLNPKNYASELEKGRELCRQAKKQDLAKDDLAFYATVKEINRFARGPLKQLSPKNFKTKEVNARSFYKFEAKIEKRLARAQEKINADIVTFEKLVGWADGRISINTLTFSEMDIVIIESCIRQIKMLDLPKKLSYFKVDKHLKTFPDRRVEYYNAKIAASQNPIDSPKSKDTSEKTQTTQTTTTTTTTNRSAVLTGARTSNLFGSHVPASSAASVQNISLSPEERQAVFEKCFDSWLFFAKQAWQEKENLPEYQAKQLAEELKETALFAFKSGEPIHKELELVVLNWLRITKPPIRTICADAELNYNAICHVMGNNKSLSQIETTWDKNAEKNNFSANYALILALISAEGCITPENLYAFLKDRIRIDGGWFIDQQTGDTTSLYSAFSRCRKCTPDTFYARHKPKQRRNASFAFVPGGESRPVRSLSLIPGVRSASLVPPSTTTTKTHSVAQPQIATLPQQTAPAGPVRRPTSIASPDAEPQANFARRGQGETTTTTTTTPVESRPKEPARTVPAPEPSPLDPPKTLTVYVPLHAAPFKLDERSEYQLNALVTSYFSSPRLVQICATHITCCAAKRDFFRIGSDEQNAFQIIEEHSWYKWANATCVVQIKIDPKSLGNPKSEKEILGEHCISASTTQYPTLTSNLEINPLDIEGILPGQLESQTTFDLLKFS